MEQRKDILTGELFQPSRSNQKFACPQNRIKYWNLQSNRLRNEIKYITSPLLNNYKILIELMGKNKEAVFHKQFLLGKGFTFSIFTNYVEYDNSNRASFLGYIFIPLENDFIKIIKT